MLYRFNTARPKYVEKVFERKVSIKDLAEEPSMFSCDNDFVSNNCGKITKEIIKCIDSNNLNPQGDGTLITDIRVQRLMPGMYPSIPGWHCDAVPRENYHAQPDFSQASNIYKHIMLIISTEDDGISRTEFADEFFWANLYPEAGFIYKQLHNEINKKIQQKEISTFQIEQGELCMFNQFNPHRAMPATSRGWRMFFRRSRLQNPTISNIIPTQQQVYLLSEENGW